MADISSLHIGNDSYNFKDSTARSGLANKQDTLTPGANITISKVGDDTVISATGGGTQIKLADVSGAAYTIDKRSVSLTWSDPDDVEISGVVLAQWEGTKVVRKIGSAPANSTDGTVIADSKTKNAHSSTPLVDNTVEYGNIYYYRFFPYTVDGVTTNGSTLSVTPTRTVISIVPTQSGTLTYDGTEQTPTWSNYNNTQLDISGDTAATLNGTYTATFTPKADYEWSDGTRTGKTADWIIGAIIITTIPSQSGTITYDGTEKTASWNNYDGTQLTVTGNTATNAGTYTASFTPKTGHTWSDGVATAKTADWVIDKADADATLSDDDITLDPNHLTATVTVTNPTGEITSVTCNDLSVATVVYSNGTITITSTEATGTATITVSIAGTANYNAGTKEIAVTGKFVTIYGVEWDGTSTTTWTRTDASTNFTDPVAAVNNGNGSSPFDTLMPWAGMVREERTGGTMVKIPKYWYKWTRTGSKMQLQIADAAVDGYLVSPAHADRGDGKGERDYVYVGAYHCASDYKSKTGVTPVGDKTRATFRSGIHNLGSTIWQYDYAMYWTIMMLYLVEYANWNSQEVVGYGCSDSGSVQNSGLCDAMTYHTGTNAASRTTYGHIRYRYIEGLWDNVYDWCDGIYFSSSSVYCIKNPANFSDSPGGTLVGTRATSSNYISGWTNPTASGYEYALYPNAVSGSESTYVCDYCKYDSSGVVLYVGGGYSQYQNRGAFCLSGYNGASVSGSGIGSRIMELP